MKNIFSALNTNGVVIFIVLLLTLTPLCWLPWVIPALKKPATNIKRVKKSVINDSVN